MAVAGGRITDDPAYRWGGFVMLVAAAAILAALGFEHVGGYSPCPLCLQQRYAYYAGVPLAFVGLVALALGARGMAAFVFALVAAAFALNAGLGVYHSGIEWGWWPGPATCAGGLTPLAQGGLLKSLESTRVIRCDEAPWRFAGLSFAGWNALISMVLAAAALKGAVSAPRG
jgi:disulfide bond formation protein DsbB